MSEVKTLGNQMEILSGFPFPSTDFTSERNGKPIIRIRDLHQQSPQTYFTGDYDGSFLISKGDVLVGMDGDFNAVKWQGPQSLLNQRVCKITTKDPMILDQDFLYHSLQPQLNSIHCGTAQTTVKHLSTKDLYSIDAELPPLPEQKKIAEMLSGVDRAVMATKNKIEKIASTQEGLANSWQEKVFLEKENGTFGDLIASIDSGWSPACEEVPPESGEWGILKVSAVTKGYFSENESKRLPSDLQPEHCKENDLLITRANGNLDLVGRGVIVEQEPSAKLLMSDKILRLKPNKDADRYFLHLLLNSYNVRRQIETAVGGSTGAKNIGQSLLRQICIAIPTPKDQAMIGSLSQSLSAAISAAHKRLDYLVSLKNGLSADLLSGRKRVSV